MSWFVNFFAYVPHKNTNNILECTWYIYADFDTATVKETSYSNVHILFTFGTMVHCFRIFLLSYIVSHW